MLTERKPMIQFCDNILFPDASAIQIDFSYVKCSVTTYSSLMYSLLSGYPIVSFEDSLLHQMQSYLDG